MERDQAVSSTSIFSIFRYVYTFLVDLSKRCKEAQQCYNFGVSELTESLWWGDATISQLFHALLLKTFMF